MMPRMASGAAEIMLWRVFCVAMVCAALISGCADAKPKDPNALPELHREPQKHHEEKTPVVDARTAPFVAAKHGKVFHKRDCPYAAHLDSPVGFNSPQEAQLSGHMPCVFCNPAGN